MMQNKKTKSENQQAEEQEHSLDNIDFSNVEGRKFYLKKKLDDLMDSIGDSYGKALMEELIFRLEKTVMDFNQEVEKMIKKLHELEIQRQRYIDAEESEEEEEVEEEESIEGVSEFERKLEEQERLKSTLNKGENKRKGLFRR